MKKTKEILRVVAFVLSFLMIVQILPMQNIAWAVENIQTQTNVEETELSSTTELETQQTYEIIGEVEELRNATTKHFRCADGSFVAAVYPVPVHYQENGKWKEVDYSLSKIEQSEKLSLSSDVYNTHSGSSGFSLPSRLGTNNWISMTNDGYTVRMRAQNATNLLSTMQIGESAELSTYSLERGQAQTDGLMSVSKAESTAIYSNVFESTDLEYIMGENGLKENIIIKSKGSNYSYDFIMDFGGLIPVSEENGSIVLREKTTQKDIFIMEAPYMYDDAGECSDEVSLTVTPNGTYYKVTVSADAEWINASERVFPVTVDPTVIPTLPSSSIEETYVDSQIPTTVTTASRYLIAGKNSLGTTRTYIKFNLPELPDCSIVTAAEMALYEYDYDAGSGTAYLNAYMVDSSSTWNHSTITWNNQPFPTTASGMSSKTVLDYTNFSAGTNGYYKWNITKAAKQWYENGNNNGLMIASSNESVTKRVRFFSSDGNPSVVFPALAISYVNNNGLESYWTYEQVDLERSGSVYVNDYNGDMTYVHTDVATSGLTYPAVVQHIYSANSEYFNGPYEGMKFGSGFRLNLLEKIESSTLDGYPYKLIDGDGTVHYFKENADVANEYYHEFDENTKLNVYTNHYELTDDEGNIKMFSKTNGYLMSTFDHNYNSWQITYNDAGTQITKLTDAAGRVITFTYNDSGFLTSMTDPAGRSVTFTYVSNFLRSITYPDGKSTTFYYNAVDGKTKLTQIVTYDTSDVLFTYKSSPIHAGTQAKITKIQRRSRYNSGRTVLNNLNFAYSAGYTIVSDDYSRENVYYFDYAGRTVYVKDQNSQVSYAEYNDGGNIHNTLKSSSNMQQSVQNLAKNHSAELTDSNWYKQGTAGSVSMVTNEHYLGEKAFKVQSTTGAELVRYCQTFSGTPGAAYTMSGYIKLEGDVTTGTGGAYIALSYENNGGWYSTPSQIVRVAEGWARYTVTVQVPSTSTGTVVLCLCINNAVATAYFDCIQLENKWAPNRYNLLENDSLDRGSGTSLENWTFSGCNSSVDGVVSNWSGKGVKFVGSPSANKRIWQDVNVGAAAGNTLVFGAWGKATPSGTVNSGNGRRFGLELTVVYTDGTKAYPKVNYNSDVSGAFQYICGAFKLEKDCDFVRYSVLYYGEVNSALFDHVQLYVDNFGSSYTYNSDGKLLTVSDGSGEGLTYTYDGPDITKITQTKDGVEQSSEKYTYDSKHNVTKVVSNLNAAGTDYIETVYTYNSVTRGQPTNITVKSKDGTLLSDVSYTYTDRENYLSTVTDARGGVTSYNYDTVKGVLNSVTDPNGNITTYTYNPNTDELLTVSGNASASEAVSNSYAYSNYDLTSITHNGFQYGFGYDSYGRSVTTSVGTQTLMTNAYASNGNLSGSTYGNGDTYTPTYDSADRITKEVYNGSTASTYAYNNDGMLARYTDYATSTTWNYFYDLAGRTETALNSDGTRLSYTYDEKGNTKTLTHRKNGSLRSDAEYTYSYDGKLTKIDLKSMDNSVLNYNYDSLNRITSSEHVADKTVLSEYDYLAVNGKQTGLVSQLTHSQINGSTETQLANFSYTYDANGNITTISENGVLKATYHYDGLDQLVREDNVWLDKTVVYDYDVGGNILSVTQYAYTTGDLGTAIGTVNYTYGDTNWKDKLTAYNGETISYDEIGNPLSYRGYTMGWTGRRLDSMSSDSVALTFKYNKDGLRTRKVSGSTTTQYTWSRSVLMSSENSTDTLFFLYSPGGAAVGVKHNGTNYYYLRNVQGDVIGIYSESGQLVCRYTYDSWGKLISVKDANGTEITDSTHIAHVNPLRYRGYYYDVETGLYYLQSRYYDPEVKRFVNADVFSNTGESLLGTNMFAYCNNNPINLSDPNGFSPDPAGLVLGLMTYLPDLIECAKDTARKCAAQYVGGKVAKSAGKNTLFSTIDVALEALIALLPDTVTFSKSISSFGPAFSVETTKDILGMKTLKKFSKAPGVGTAVAFFIDLGADYIEYGNTNDFLIAAGITTAATAFSVTVGVLIAANAPTIAVATIGSIAVGTAIDLVADYAKSKFI